MSEREVAVNGDEKPTEEDKVVVNGDEKPSHNLTRPQVDSSPRLYPLHEAWGSATRRTITGTLVINANAIQSKLRKSRHNCSLSFVSFARPERVVASEAGAALDTSINSRAAPPQRQRATISNAASVMALHRLAPELLCLIFSSLDSPQDLYSLIRASPSCLQAFLPSRRITLSSIIRNVLLPESIHDALALLHIPKPPPGADPDLQEIEAFLDQYPRGNSWHFPTDLPSVVLLTRLASRISWFINGYFDYAMGTLATVQDHSGNWSPIERARLQRAFLRFEIYCRICLPSGAHPWTSLLSPDFMFHHFLEKLEPWEVEEITCIYEYFVALVGQYMLDREDKFIRTIMAHPRL
ncbi:hypothetical protein F5Y09DRAFT_353498 [Xylaria sp. FL1042]|nr:hypothetical protein F5Y09DRAFT_353498 [Xylaria sp. FL1042]